MLFGPVSAARHAEPTVLGSVFSMGIGLFTSGYVWFRFWRAQDTEPKPPIENMIWITLIAAIFVGTGIWELVRALRTGG